MRATKHHQTMLDDAWSPNISRLYRPLVTKHADAEVSGQTVKTCLINKLNTDQTIDTSHRASVVRMLTSNMFDTRLSKRTKHRPSNRRTKNVFNRMFDSLPSRRSEGLDKR